MNLSKISVYLQKAFKTCLIFLTATFLFSSCTKKTAPLPQDNNVKIMATFYPLYIMLLNICDGVEGVELSMLAPADTGCLHDYQLTTKDMKALEKCSLLVMNGAGMEDFAEKALEIKKDFSVNACDGYTIFDDNPHVWVSPEGAIYEVSRIADFLAQKDSVHKEQYLYNAQVYIKKLEDLKKTMHEALDEYSGTSMITFHEAFPYFASEFNLNIAAIIERDAGTEPSARELKELIDLIKNFQSQNEKIFLTAEEQYSSSAAEVISKETGLKVYQLDPAVTGKLYKDAYLDAMYKNVTVLKEALSLLSQ